MCFPAPRGTQGKVEPVFEPGRTQKFRGLASGPWRAMPCFDETFAGGSVSIKTVRAGRSVCFLSGSAVSQKVVGSIPKGGPLSKCLVPMAVLVPWAEGDPPPCCGGSETGRPGGGNSQTLGGSGTSQGGRPPDRGVHTHAMRHHRVV